MRARAAENTGVIVNGAWSGETCCDKQTRRGRCKNTEAPPPRPFLPSLFRIFRRCHKPLFGRRRSFPCFRTKAKPQRTVAMRKGPKSPRSDQRPFSVGRRGYFHAHWVTVKPRERGRFIFLDNTPDSPSTLPIAICPYFCPDHQKGYRRFGGFNP